MRRSAYFFMRENAIKRARRSMLIGTLVLIISIVVASVISNQPPAVVAPSTPTRIIVVAAPTKTDTPTPLPAPTVTPTPSPTAINTVAPTALPKDVPGLLLTPLPSAVPPATNAKFTLTTLASVLDSKQKPVDGGTIFPQGSRAIHIFFRASGMNNGARWAVFCKKGDRIVDSFIDLWKWGPLSQPSHAVCSIDGSVGSYTVVSYIDFTKQFEAPFTIVVPPPTVAPTLTPAPTATP